MTLKKVCWTLSMGCPRLSIFFQQNLSFSSLSRSHLKIWVSSIQRPHCWSSQLVTAIFPFTSHQPSSRQIEEAGPLAQVNSSSSQVLYFRSVTEILSCLENNPSLRLLDHLVFKSTLQAQPARLEFKCSRAWMWYIRHHWAVTCSTHQFLRLDRPRICVEMAESKSLRESTRCVIIS